MKNIIALLLCAVMIISLFSCARKSESGHVLTTTKTESVYESTTQEVAVPDTSFSEDITTIPETTETTPVQTEEPIYIDGDYQYAINIRPYLQYICTNHKSEYLIIANRKHPLGKSYKPTDLVRVMNGSQWYLRKAAKEAFEAMRLEMQKLGVYDTYNRSTYRSYSFQSTLYNNYLARERKNYPHLSENEIMAIVDTYSARPGTSDHQTGLTIDFNPLTVSFAKLKAFKYMKDNAHKFGFILRYPEGKTYITGYKYEPWHWRFVGREAATYIYEHDLTLEEYMAYLNGTEVETFPETTPIPPVTEPSDTTEPLPDITTEEIPSDTSSEPIISNDNEDTEPEIMSSGSTEGSDDDEPQISDTIDDGSDESEPVETTASDGEVPPQTNVSDGEVPPQTNVSDGEAPPQTTISNNDGTSPAVTTASNDQNIP